MRQYRLEQDAQQDLTNISDFIGNDSVPAAEKLIDRFHDMFRFLAENRFAGERRADLAPEMRMFTMGNYVILFKPAPSGVSITHVVHAARDLQALFKPAN